MTEYYFDRNDGNVYEYDTEAAIERDKEREDYLADYYHDLWTEEHENGRI